MVRYYGWYSNRARGERAKREAETGAPEATDVDVIDVSEYHPPRIPSKKWRELIKIDKQSLFGRCRRMRLKAVLEQHVHGSEDGGIGLASQDRGQSTLSEPSLRGRGR
jgi:hypothetical protein